MPTLDKPKTLLIRAEAGPKIGVGHVMRMLALAQAWQDRGGNVTFAAIQCPNKLTTHIVNEGFHYRKINASAAGTNQDATATCELAKELEINWIILDGYEFGNDFQIQIKTSGLRTLVVDDHGYCNDWCADVILNQNLSAQKHNYGSIRTLLGVQFALLRREFRLESGLIPFPKTDKIKRLLINYGGADPVGATAKTLKIISKFKEHPLEIRVIVGPAYEKLNDLNYIALKNQHSIELLSNVKDMHVQYKWADGFLGAGGSTCWELLFYGLRASLVPIASNQENIVNALITRKLACSAGYYENDNVEIEEKLIHQFLTTPIDQFSNDPQKRLVDGRGAERVAALLDNRLRICVGTSKDGWLFPLIKIFVQELENEGHTVCIATTSEEIKEGDILLLLSFWEIVKPSILKLNTHNLVVHASNLPEGRGWSPWTWQVIEGKEDLTLSLIEAAKGVDTGDIYDQITIPLAGSELLSELRSIVLKGTIELCRTAIKNYPNSIAAPIEQKGDASYYRRRSPADSELNPDLSLRDQFNLLRVVDNEAYPAFFKIGKNRFVIKIESDDEDS